MAWHGIGNRPINSTQGVVETPSTASLIAELDSTQLGTVNLAAGQSLVFQVSYVLGSDTSTTWQVGVSNSTALNSGADEFFPKTGAYLSGQYVLQHELGPNQRIRARIATASSNASAKLSAVAMT